MTTAAATIPAPPLGRGALSNKFVRLQRATLFAAAAAAFAAVAVSQALPAWAIAGFGLAWIAGLFLRERSSRGFGTATNLLTVLGVLVLLAPAVRDQDKLPIAAAETALLLCANRLLVRRTSFDDGMLHLSCWLVLASGAALTGELLYGLCLLVYAALAAVSMTFSELRRGIEEEAPEQAQSLFAAPELTSRRLWAFSASLGLFSAAFGALVFPLFPRAQLGYMNRFGIGPATSGIGDRVDLSGSGGRTFSSKLVLQAHLKGDRQLAHYWRGVTLERFSGRGWSPVQTQSKVIQGLNHPGRRPKLEGTFELFADSGRHVPVPNELIQLWPTPFGLSLRQSQSGDLRLAFGAPPLEDFTVAAGGAPAVEPGREELALELQLPDLSPTVTALARQLIPDGASAEEAIRDVTRYLKGFTYTLDLPATETPLEDFLARRNGDCQLFASATTVLLRARGIPARYVAGYYAPDPTAETLSVREWDAHAWAEAYVPGRGFVLVDNTPPDMRGGRHTHTVLWENIRDLWDRVQLDWLHGIVDFDLQAQEQSAGWLVRHLQAFVWSILSPSHRSRTWMASLLLALVLGYLLYRLPRRQQPALRLERALFRTLAARGLPRALGETYEEALAKIQVKDAALAREAELILARLAAARFGGRPLDSGEAAALGSRIQRLA